MSQIAIFTYLKESDVPFLGLWSKPRRRLFRRPENRFAEFVRAHTLRESVFTAAGGIYVAFVFAWLEAKGLWSESEEDPVIKTVRNHIEGAHWLIEFRHARKILQGVKPFSADEWRPLLERLGERESDFVRDFFEAALQFVLERLSDLKEDEALLVFIG